MARHWIWTKHIGERWEDSPESLIRVHGALTFSAFCQENAEHGIDPVWWFGFDCAHLHDYIPKYPMDHAFTTDTYKDIAYVREECRLMAMQLIQIKLRNRVYLKWTIKHVFKRYFL